MKKVIILFFALILYVQMFAQNIKALKIGDRVPDLVFHHILNYKKSTAKLSDFKGKLVILDMWGTTCTSCIAAFPEMEELQRTYKDKIQILLVNPQVDQWDSEEKIKMTLQKNKTRTGFYPSLPIPIHDAVLNDYFPHRSVPHEVWIDGSGKIIAIVGLMETTSENIESVLQGKTIHLPLKNDYRFDDKKPFLINGYGVSRDDVIYHSLFTKYVGSGGDDGNRQNDNGNIVGYFRVNTPLMLFIVEAYPDLILDRHRILYDVTDIKKFSWESHPSNLFTYDLTIPPTPVSSFNIRPYLQQDLKRAFNISVHKEKRRMQCYVLTVTENAPKFQTKYSKDNYDYDLDKTAIRKYIHNLPMYEVIKMLFSVFDKLMIDETGISDQSIDIDFPDNFDIANQQAIIDYLKKIGFDIREEEREIEVAIITDKDKVKDQ